MELKIDKDDVIGEVKKLSSFAGRNLYDAEGNSLYDRVHITTQDEAMIESFITEARTTVMSLFGRYIFESAEGGLLLNVSNIGDLKLEAMADSIVRFVINQSFAKWLSVNYPDAAETYYTNATAELDKARRMTLPDNPKRPTYEDKEEEEE